MVKVTICQLKILFNTSTEIYQDPTLYEKADKIEACDSESLKFKKNLLIQPSHIFPFKKQIR